VTAPPEELDRFQTDAFLNAAEAWDAWEAGDRDEYLEVLPPGTSLTYWVVPGRTEPLIPDWEPDLEKVKAWVRPVDPVTGHKRRGPAPGRARLEKEEGASGTCGVLIQRSSWAGRRCPKIAGQGTGHVGVGHCVMHGGAKRYGRAYGAWLMAHAFGQELQITPWEALLKAVRIAAGKSAYIEWVLAQAKSDLELEGRVTRTGEGEDQLLLHPDTGEPLGVGAFRDLSFWVKQSELWHDRMARTAKMAIDAGVARWQIEKAQADANAISRVLNAVLEAAAETLTDEQVAHMRRVMRTELLALDQENSRREIAGTSDADAGVVDSTYRDNV
jgi:hypothetical protein